MILQLYPATAGNIIFEGQELTELSTEELRRIRPRMQMIFQDPHASLNPRMTVGSIVSEPLLEHVSSNSSQRKARVEELWVNCLLARAGDQRCPDGFSNPCDAAFSGAAHRRELNLPAIGMEYEHDPQFEPHSYTHPRGFLVRVCGFFRKLSARRPRPPCVAPARTAADFLHCGDLYF